MWGPRKTLLTAFIPSDFAPAKNRLLSENMRFPSTKKIWRPFQYILEHFTSPQDLFSPKKKVVFQNRCIFFYIPLQYIEMYRVFVKGRWIWREWGWKGYPLRRFPSIDVFKKETFLLESLSVQLNIFYPPFFFVSFLGFVGIFLAIRRFYFSMETYVKTPKMGMIDSPKLLNVLPYRLLKDYSDYRVCGIIFFPPHFTNLCISPFFSWLWIFSNFFVSTAVSPYITVPTFVYLHTRWWWR